MSGDIETNSCDTYAVVDISKKKRKISKNTGQCTSGDVAQYAVLNRSKLGSHSYTSVEKSPHDVKMSETASMNQEESPSVYSVLECNKISNDEPEKPGNRSTKMNVEITTEQFKLKLFLLVLSLAIILLLIVFMICIAVAFTRISRMNSDLYKFQSINSGLVDRITDLNVTFEMEHRSLYDYINSVLNATVGDSPSFPARSCEAIYYHAKIVPTSGYYWLRSANGSSVEVYCEMNKICGGSRGGRMKVVQLNNKTSSEICRDKLKVQNSNRSRCVLSSDDSGGCSSNIFNVMNVQYSHICGSVEGYGRISVDGFMGRTPQPSISDNYVDGVSLTLGSTNKTHVWTFVAKADRRTALCPSTSPSFVDNDYSCLPFMDDSEAISCPDVVRCSQNFNKILNQPTSDDIEMRVCRDQDGNDENVIVGNIEIYVW